MMREKIQSGFSGKSACTESACTSFCFIQCSDLPQLGNQNRQNYKLCHTHPGFYSKSFGAVIDQGNHKLATIIAVHQANAVCQGNAMLGRQTGTGENTDGNILPGRRNGKSGRDFGNFTGAMVSGLSRQAYRSQPALSFVARRGSFAEGCSF